MENTVTLSLVLREERNKALARYYALLERGLFARIFNRG